MASNRSVRTLARDGVLVLLLAGSPGGAFAAEPASALRIDGELTESVWSRAEPIVAFVQREPDEGAPPGERTEARVLYDDQTLYVAVRAFDSRPDEIKAFLTRRDMTSSSDWIRVYIDSYHDRRSAYSFAVNPLGVKIDTYHFNDINHDDSWDAVWDVAVARDASGWRAEFRIPLSQLRFGADTSGTLGFAVARTLARLNETSTWPLISRSADRLVSSFGELAGVVRSAPTKRLEVVPYALQQLRGTPLDPGNPLQHNPDPTTALGVDLKYAVTPSLSLTATVNPDFGQVEADPAVVNLTAFEVFFQERRPFFVEGSGNYTFECRDCSLFYSRRIGRTPRGTPELADGEFRSQPDQSTILGAAKLTGRARSFSLGSMVALTDEESARIGHVVPGAAGAARTLAVRDHVVEPRTFYSVSRARREFSDQSSLGFILTNTTRQLTDAVTFLPDSATTGGVDMDWRLGQRWSLTAYWAGSHLTGAPVAIEQLQTSTVHGFQRPGANHVTLDPSATSLDGHSANLAFSKIAGRRTRGTFSVGYRSPGFDTNDLGFMQRADQVSQYAWIGFQWLEPTRLTRSRRLNFNQWSNFTFGGQFLDVSTNVNTHWLFQNQWGAGAGVNFNPRGFDDRLTRGGPGGRTNSNVNSWQYMYTDARRSLGFNWDSNLGADRQGTWSFQARPRLVLRPTSALSAELGLNYSRSTNAAQWIEQVSGADSSASSSTHYVFGRLNQTTASLTTRLNYTLSPTLSLQSYAQPFVSAGVYRGYTELARPLADRTTDRYSPFAYDDNADFSVLTFRTTNVLRWEYRPGSTLFVVWQQGRDGSAPRAGSGMGSDFGHLFATPASNTVLVKVAYWFNR
jgi:hypothetical protein